MIINIFWRFPANKKKLGPFLNGITKRYITNASQVPVDRFIRQFYSVLEVDPSCCDETVIRKAYLEKVKQYHPDSSFQDNRGDHTKFNQVQQAYKALIETLKSNNSLDQSSSTSADDDYVKFDIRHTAPQHRTHLEYGGFGMGTPSSRQTAYYKMRAEKAYENVYEYRRDRESIETSGELIERKKRKDVRSTNFIDRLVEDLIQESMSRGDFNNIKPSGKTLHERNPHYMDFTTYKINEILIDNGYIPEWIQLEKQVREFIEQARIDMKRVFKAISSENLQSSDEKKSYLSNNIKWAQAIEKFRNDIIEVNLIIDKINLIVPMLWRQQVHYNADREIAKIVALNPLKIELPPSEEELAQIHKQTLDQRHQEWINHQSTQRYSVFDAIRDLVQSLRNFKV
ncbi:unnamed protein product [Rotaria magnacalcarata]|uniref:J domain-containing protein n=2 Tax=Rotaria magnacalcarata TaxID=392030 RepID=A0A817ANN5_9BILA|nr:unnamed protein product [Rotaria magnacalcarata]CAF1670290.1 unnamed protein product [Rotaria magnacalcarata]CAF2254470.1 unnamed protein product [Rotaria magnacalcarata]CAF3946580.1 unnamed protein product [Rotaria magnacalcarata]CAF4189383.1 unnamed protein product [Rotaria magnacalcarata]